MGQNLGPGSVAARAPKRDKPKKDAAAQCSICLADEVVTWPTERKKVSSLEGGRCKDREACQARQPQLEMGLEKIDD